MNNEHGSTNSEATATTNKCIKTTSSKTIEKADKAAQMTSCERKKKILNPQEYKDICDFLLNYTGLIIECELEMIFHRFPTIERLTLKSIVQTEIGLRARSQHWRQDSLGKKHLKSFEQESADSWNNKILVNIAIKEQMSPVSLCRAILQEKYQYTNKAHITRLLKYPTLIEDTKLAANVVQCLCADSQEGPIIDLRRRVLGEEYEFKLKQLATSTGMHFYDENDLRRLGYDKTPDIKMILPFLYKNEVVNWIESKACFGDPKTHKKYIQQQLNSYTNRFGPGMVIYWFGYHTETLSLPENSVGIIVLEDFPDIKNIDFLELNTDEFDDMSMNGIFDNTSIQNLEATRVDVSELADVSKNTLSTAELNTP